ncbi:MAG TPA: hypothetical protein VM658_02780 [bacterium]|nr:hypothetical protein [bacterium]
MKPISDNLLIDLKINAVLKTDIESSNSIFNTLHSMVSSHSIMYPRIDEWFKKKVTSGIKTSSRKAYLGYINNRPIVSAVLKIDKNAKFCHLHIEDGFRHNHIGETLFSIMALDSRRIARNFHFTLPESLWEDQKQFFKSFGFDNPIKATRQYRLFDQEYLLEAPFDIVWMNALNKLPKLINYFSEIDSSTFNGILVSIKPHYLDKIRNKVKTVEIRKKFNKNYIGKKAILYSSSPSKTLCGYATIQDIVEDDPFHIWKQFGAEIGASEKDYYKYTCDCNKIFAIILTDICLYKDEIYLDQIINLINKKLIPPQSYLLIDNNPLWQEAISIAELLQRRFGSIAVY